ncbi:MAG: alanine dehydrogenase, partial [Cyclobacteriaceae bacterium]|nr:alanine dehydrogenase [Cyclobacteriaceae bacterium]
EEVYEANIILKIEPPTHDEIGLMKTNQVLISALQIGNQNPEYISLLNKKKITAIAYEFIEDKVGGFPIIRAMSEIAGSTVMLIAAEYLSNSFSGKGIIIGGITGVPPTKVVILGAGTVAEYAARAALGMGADISIFDNHLYKLRRIKHAIGQQVYTSTIDTFTLSNTLKDADVLIGALRHEKGRVKHVITDEMVANMRPDSLIIDLTIDQGGCIETSDITTLNNPIFRRHGVIHYCVPNIASRVAHTASTALSNIFTPTILRAGDEGGLEEMIFAHSWFMKGVYCYNGHLTNPNIGRKFGIKYKDMELFIAGRY